MRFLLALSAALAVTANAHAFITDDFEVDSSADYTVVNDGTPDGSFDFTFDYIAAGIPLAPNSAAGDTTGLKFTANDTAGASDAITAFHNAVVSGASKVTMSVDVYMNVSGTGGTTEYAHVGIAGDGSSVNTVFLPISGSGTFAAFTGEGGSSTSDYRYFIEGQTTTDSSDPSYLAGNGANTSQLYQDIFPNTDGSPENLWTTFTIEFANGEVVYAFDGTPIFDTSLIDPSKINNELTSPDGQISLGYADVFSSVAAPFQSQFVVYDNLSVAVELIPEPTTALLAAFGCMALFVRRR